MNVSAIGGQVLFTGLLRHFIPRNDKRARISVIASERKRRVAIQFILCCAQRTKFALCALLSVGVSAATNEL